MTNDEEKNFDFMVDVAWKVIEGTQNSIIRLENKAYNMIALSGIFITAIVTVFVGLLDKIPPITKILFILELIFLILCVGFSFKTIWLQKQELLDIFEIIDKIDFKDAINTKGIFAISMETLQEKRKAISYNKSSSLKKGMKMFLIALIMGILIMISAIDFQSLWNLLLRC